MRSLRTQLALWYALAMAATVFVFAVIVYQVQRRQSVTELDNRVRLEADLIAAILGEAYRARGHVVVTDTASGQPAMDPEVAELLQGVPGFVLILLQGRDVLFVSAEARTLRVPQFSEFFEILESQDSTEAFGLINLSPPLGQVRYSVQPVRNAGPTVAGVVAGVSTAGVELGPRRLLSAMLLVTPVIIVASTGIGYQLVRRTLRPVEHIVDEVEAISDGRSLHRRLATAGAFNEFARLTTTLNQMLARLEQSFASLRRFTADASHELKTPLTVIRSGIERAITHPRAPPDQLAILEELLVETNRMAEIMDSLLMLARADEGRAPLHLDDVDLRALLSEIAETAGILGEQASVDVEVRVPGAPAPVRADKSRIRQLLMNLLTNAIKYTPAGGHVWIDAVDADGRVVFTVRDTGIGIAAGDLPHVFDRFWRADHARTRTSDRPGVGLGLAICKWIAEAHGGAIAVESRPGRGTTFTVSIPHEGEVNGVGPAT